MADPVVHITNGVPDLGTGNITTLGMTINAIGSATSGQSGPLMMGAVTTSSPSYATGQTNPFSLDTTGALRVNVTGTNNIGGTFSSFGSAFPAVGTAAGAEYLSSPPTLTNGQMVALQTNVNGALKVDGSAITQPISGTITANQGGAWNVGITGTVTVSGTVTSNQGGAPWSMKPDGTTWAMTSTSANVNVTNASIPVTGTFWQTTQPVSGTVAATQSGTWTVQPGNTANTTAWLVTGTGGTFPITATSLPLPSGASTSANQPTNAAQGSTTSGQTGHLMMGAVTTGNPTYTTAQTSPFSLDTSGALRVNVIAGSGGGGTSSSFGAAIPAAGTAGGFSDGTNMQLARVFDGDTGAGTQYSLGVLLKTPGSGGAVDFGVSGQPIRIDPTGTTTQPVSGTVGISGTVAATQSGSWTVQPGNTANTTAWLVTGTGGTFPATQSGNWTSRIVGNGGATLDAVVGNAAAPTNMLAVGGVFNTTRPTLTTGQSSAFQSNNNGVQLVDGSTVTQPVSGNVGISGTAAVTQSGTWTVQPGNTANTTAWLVTGTGGTFPVTGTFWQATQPVSIAATVNTSASQSGTWTVQPGNTANTTPWLVLDALTAASNGLTSSRVAAAATTNATSLKASAGEMARIDVFNTATYAVFLKFYNKASSPTVGTDTPVWTIPVSAGGGYSTEFMRGKYFSTGIAYAITKLQADNDTTAVVAGDLTGSIDWI